MSNEPVFTDLKDIINKSSIITPRFDIDPAHQFDIYHIAMLKWLEDVTRDETIQNPDMRFDLGGVPLPDTIPSQLIEKLSKTIPVVYGTPDRAFAQVFIFIDIIRRNLGLPPIPEDIQRRYLALPMISFVMNRCTAKREWFVRGHSTFAFLSDTEGLVYLYPKPYDLDYTVTLWARSQQVLLRLYERILLQFRHNTMYFEVDFTPLNEKVGKKLVSIEITGSNDRSELEPGDKRDRVLRMDISFEVHGYLFLQGFIGKRALRSVPEVKPEFLK